MSPTDPTQPISDAKPSHSTTTTKGERKMSTSIARRATAALGALTLGVLTAIAAVAPAQGVTLPGNIDPTQARSLTVHKFALGPESPQQIGTGQELPSVPGTPLAGAEFTATLVADVDLLTPQGWEIVANLTPAQAATRLSASSFTSGPTNTAGVATFPGDLPIGLYLVTETTLPDEATNPVAPFLVTLPFPTGPSGAPANEWIYDVHVYPKNAVTELTKTRIAPAANSVEARNPDLIRWAIAASIPTLAAGDTIENFVLTDTIPAELEYVETPPTGVTPTNVVVTNAAGIPQNFVAGTDYAITTTGADQTLTFTPAGLLRLSNLQGGEVSFNVLTRAVAIPADGSIENIATGTVNGSTETVIGVTPIGQLTVFAFEAIGNGDRTPLQGAVYQVYLTQQDADRNQNPIVIDGISQWTTGADGFVEIPIITPGTYYVREVTPPAGFQLPTPDRVVTQVVAGETSTVPPVRNYVEFQHQQVPAFALPLTGGDGGLWFSVGGAAMILTALGAAVIVARRRAAQARVADSAAV
ncbi:SpaH/EbpB family LPXTG-anchored major pilin [Microbacterium invictum]|uniref:SpaH/EbpB family LPXTG-anchored major pilin n=1 Tax=Microbacterium invictum TaxID=515415 RepID=A0ABZ0VAT2_9MICO|nr:SpaH/EbpB family LPXTG-anchored major pilin [Microbacterium invictum]WQB69993.1 SpaH/EbpB family LPXTG-anchored major pilin [Microbacterium invictum]